MKQFFKPIMIFIIFQASCHCYVMSASVNSDSISIDSVDVVCDQSQPICQDVQRSAKLLINTYTGIREFRDVLKIYIRNIQIEEFTYLVSQRSDGSHNLLMDFKAPHFIKNVQVRIDGKKDPFDMLNQLRSRPNQYFSDSDIEADRELISTRLSLLGFHENTVKANIKVTEKGNRLSFSVNTGKQVNISTVHVSCGNDHVRKYLNRIFGPYKNSRYDREAINNDISATRKTLFEQGYYFLRVTPVFPDIDTGGTLRLDCENTQLVSVAIDDENNIYNKARIFTDMRMVVQRSRFNMLSRELERYFVDLYKGHGFLNPLVHVERRIVDKREDYYHEQFRIKIPKQQKTKLRNLIFRGNNFFESDELKNIFYKDMDALASRGHFDWNYYKKVVDRLRVFYVQRGFLSVEIMYSVRVSSEPDQFSLFWEVFEGRRSVVKSMEIHGLDHIPHIKAKLKSTFLETQEGKPFNPMMFEEEKGAFLELIREEGFLNAQFTHIDDKEVVRYSAANQEVSITLNVDPGKKILLKDTMILGVVKTQPSIIKRKIRTKVNDVITPTYLDLVRVDLASMGIFSTYEVVILDDTMKSQKDYEQYAKMIIRVTERDYGAVELAPGFRSDLGVKLSSRFTLSNLQGKNRSLTFSALVNQRVTFREFDSSRRDLGGHFLEYDFRATYNYPDFFESYWDYAATAAISKRRFFSFDADIKRISNTFSKDLTRRINFSLRHQYETIEQFNAVRETDNGNFEIGAITPGITLDYRDNPAFTTKGAFINLSCEIARPEFLSQNDPDARIDFYKLVSRNRFFIPFGDFFVLAMSLTTGVQKNMAQQTRTDEMGNPVTDNEGNVLTRGSIPAIKVFRLTGVDLVRGFAEEEINRVADGLDVSQALIKDKAYMTNVKIEPRYLLNDQMSVGMFYDAGAVQIESYNPFSLRDSVGVTLKFITPVGTLDFDYGVKINRRTLADGTLESPGRFHVSIGFL